jgi:branched-chain amino acid transport system permease protein
MNLNDAATRRRARDVLIAVGLVVAVAWPFLGTSNYLIAVGSLALTFAVLGQSLNLLYGFAGYLSIATTVFWAIGAYTSARLTVTYDVNPLLAMLAGGVLAAAVAALFGLIAMRQGRDSFAILSLVFALMAALLASTWTSVTKGTQGIAGLPVVTIGPASWGIRLLNERDYYYATLVVTVIAVTAYVAVTTSRWGKLLLATKADEQLAASFGVALLRERVRALCFGAFFCGFVGGLHAFRISVVDPSLLSLVYLAPLLGGLFLGGPGNVWGNLLATVFVAFLPELTRSFSTNRNLIYGAVLLVLCLAFPDGLPGAVRRWTRHRRSGTAPVDEPGSMEVVGGGTVPG